MAAKLNELSITEATRGLRAKDFSVRELWDACATAAKEKNEDLHAFLELFDADDTAIKTAQTRIDAEGSEAPLLCGIPLAIKDNILIEGHVASAASKILEGYIAPYDSTAIKKLKESNALFVGRANMDEFGMGASTEHSAYGPTKNPHDTSRVPGGSSGGSAVAVATHLALGAYGSDTGGSCRQPAAHCGVIGFKPTYGSVSRHGLIALGSSLDQIGELGKTVADVRALFQAVRGHDAMDATSFPDGFYAESKIFEHATVGVPRHLIAEGVDADVLATFEATLGSLRERGHRIVDIELPTSAYGLPSYYIIMPAEASTNLARYDGIRYGHAARGGTLLNDYVLSRTEGFGAETQRRILLGTFVLSSGYIDAYYRKAEAARPVLRAEYATAFEKCDVVAFPTTPSPAFKFGGKSDPVSMYLEDIFTVTANLTGMPAISIPMGNVERDGSSLPTGIHFTAPHGQEERLFRIGADVTGETL
ncbi:MAG: aspartyl-tRNA(Asn)/glutamyl-tRNA(Gln) amidotransferase subunit [Candidatus Parcubacteria bacterium]|jgi:aspartyl-tRNA(Asn)/glutamyl-tRNA(Gln) amidotransferase subunit A|nr:aspartyl-tRNA(Asn)/glutamyl-tRNA(Gln) amidotransferase subunit [Candidatus Parcubacteria bacterium]